MSNPNISLIFLAGEMLNDIAYIATGLILLLLSWACRRLSDRYEALLKEQANLREDIKRLEWHCNLAPVRRGD